MPTVVVLGASMAGLPLAHYLSKHLPEKYSVTLVNPSKTFYWNLASPRALVDPSRMGKKADDLFLPFLPAFEKYPPGRFTFIHGSATATDPKAHTVTVRSADGNDVVVTYEQLVIATGASGAAKGVEWGFKPVRAGNTEEVVAAARAQVAAAHKIVVSGGGATGVELAGEIADRYNGQKQVVLVTAGEDVLDQIPRKDIRAAANKLLKRLGVEVITGAKVVEETKGASSGVELALSDGQRVTADLHIAAWGLSPNTSYLPNEMLDGSGWVVTDEYMRAKGHQDIWAIGDVTHWGNRKLTTIEAMHNALVKNLLATVNHKPETAFAKYEHSDGLLIAVPIGRKFAYSVGFISGWKAWGFVGWLLKGLTYMVEYSRPIAEGVWTTGHTKL